MIVKVVVARLVGASSLPNADDRNRMEGLFGRGGRVGLYYGPTVSQITEDADDRLLIVSIYLSIYLHSEP